MNTYKIIGLKVPLESTLTKKWGGGGRLSASGKHCLELGDFGEMEIADFHGRDDHLERLFAGGADGGTELRHVRQHLENVLVEAEVADAGGTRRWQPAWANGRLAGGVVMEQFRTPVTIISCE